MGASSRRPPSGPRSTTEALLALCLAGAKDPFRSWWCRLCCRVCARPAPALMLSGFRCRLCGPAGALWSSLPCRHQGPVSVLDRRTAKTRCRLCCPASWSKLSKFGPAWPTPRTRFGLGGAACVVQPAHSGPACLAVVRLVALWSSLADAKDPQTAPLEARAPSSDLVRDRGRDSIPFGISLEIDPFDRRLTGV